MKRTKTIILSLLLLLALLFGGCGDGEFTQNDNSPEINQSTVVAEIDENNNSEEDNETEESYQHNEINEDRQNIIVDSQLKNQTESNSVSNQTLEQNNNSFSLTDVPAYNGNAYVAINNNEPFFTQADYTTKSFERYSSLDGLGRCGVVFDNV